MAIARPGSPSPTARISRSFMAGGSCRGPGSARALVEDPGGQSYIIAKGTRIGKNDGTVTKIDDNLVVVNETYEDYLGNVTQKDIEMRIRRSEGG